MKFGAWLALTGVSTLAVACSGTATLGVGVGDAGGSGGAGVAGGGLVGSAGSNVAGDAAVGGRSTVADGGAGFGGNSSAGSIGLGGVGGQPPLTDVGPQQQSSKLDVLFVVDNSPGMGQKQALLAASLPSFVQHLVNPPCVDTQGNPVATQPTSGTAACSSGTRQFAPVTDLHLGAITTSIGGHGGEVCSPADAPAGSHQDDQAELLATKRTGVTTYMNTGFLSFDPAGKTGIADSAALTTQLQSLINAAGETGCGFEAPLEAMYRFLIDPEPPIAIEKNSQNVPVSTGVNQDLLDQREAFLRPDSSVAIVVLSDENDCSILDSGAGWIVSSSAHMPAATAACVTNPNDPCCRSCATNETSPPVGCTPLAQDPVCSLATPPNYETLDFSHDSLNLRCFDQKQRFGIELLNPVERYSEALTNPQIVDATGAPVDNPLFAARDGKPARSASLISLSVIVGAPWEDLASDDSRTSADLTYLDAASLESKQRWPLLVGDAANNVAPSDPLMIESIDARSGTSPLTNAPLVPDTSMNPLANADNGHEQNIADRDDLQYACIFPLAMPVTCADGDATCPCSYEKNGDSSSVVLENSPICQPPASGPASNRQYYAKANPGTRELLVARALGARAAPASICSRGASAVTSPTYGYVPALSALVDRVAVTLQ